VILNLVICAFDCDQNSLLAQFAAAAFLFVVTLTML